MLFEEVYGAWTERRLTQEEAADMESANRYLAEVYRPAFNAEFAQPAREPGSAFVPCRDAVGLARPPPAGQVRLHRRTVGGRRTGRRRVAPCGA